MSHIWMSQGDSAIDLSVACNYRSHITMNMHERVISHICSQVIANCWQFMAVTWLIYMYAKTPLYVWHDSFIRVTWQYHVRDITCMCDMTHMQDCWTLATLGFWHNTHTPCVTWRIHMCYIAYSYVRHDSFIYVTWFIHMCAVTVPCVWYDSYVWCDSYARLLARSNSWFGLQHKYLMCHIMHTYPNVWHDASCHTLGYIPQGHIGVCTPMCDMTHTYPNVWHDVSCLTHWGTYPNITLGYIPQCVTWRIHTPMYDTTHTYPMCDLRHTSAHDRFDLRRNAKLKVKRATNYNWGVVLWSEYDPWSEFKKNCFGRVKHLKNEY